MEQPTLPLPDLVPPGYRRCPRCGVVRHLNAFPRDASRPNGRFSYCTLCHRSYQSAWKHDHPEQFAQREARTIAKAKAWQAAHPEEYALFLRRRELLRRYGITPEEYGAMLEDQDGHCAICPRKPEEEPHGVLHVDHDHACCGPKTACRRCVRGLLCGPHNFMLGCARDDVDILHAAIDYLSRNRSA